MRLDDNAPAFNSESHRMIVRRQFALLAGGLIAPELAAEIARLNCDVIFAPGAEAALNAVKQASRDTPNV